MAEYSLTLSALKYANVTNFSRPFGTKKTTLQNAGSLTTEEFNIVNALPFDIQRPLVITETSTVSNIQYDAKIVINAASTTLTLASTGVTEGITVTLMAAYDTTIVFNNTSSATTISDTLHAGEIAKLVFFGGRWEVVQDLGEVKGNPTDTKPFGALIVDGSTYSKVKYPRLANFLGVRYNLSTDSSDVFRLPDLRNRTIMGANPDVTGKADGNTSNVGDVQLAQVPNVKGTVLLKYARYNANEQSSILGDFGQGALTATGQASRDFSRNNQSGMNSTTTTSGLSEWFNFDASGTNASVDHLGNNVYHGDFNNSTEANRTFGELRSANVRMNWIIKY